MQYYANPIIYSRSPLCEKPLRFPSINFQFDSDPRHRYFFLLYYFISDPCQTMRSLTKHTNTLLSPTETPPTKITQTPAKPGNKQTPIHHANATILNMNPEIYKFVCDTRTCIFATAGAKKRQNRHGGETRVQREKDRWRQRDRRMSRAGHFGDDRRPLDIDGTTVADVDGFVGRLAPKRTSATDHVCVFFYRCSVWS